MNVESVPTRAQLKHFSLTRWQYEILGELNLGKGLLVKNLGKRLLLNWHGPELTILVDRGLAERKGQRLLVTEQGRTILAAIRALVHG